MPRLDRIYTKTGDEGMTGLGGGRRVPKDSPRVVAYGTVDELNSAIGVALRLRPERAAGRASSAAIQNELFDLGADLCWPDDDERRARIPTVQPRHIERLEATIDELNDAVGPLTNFLLPGGSPGRGRSSTSPGRSAGAPSARRSASAATSRSASSCCPT